MIRNAITAIVLAAVLVFSGCDPSGGGVSDETMFAGYIIFLSASLDAIDESGGGTDFPGIEISENDPITYTFNSHNILDDDGVTSIGIITGTVVEYDTAEFTGTTADLSVENGLLGVASIELEMDTTDWSGTFTVNGRTEDAEDFFSL